MEIQLMYDQLKRKGLPQWQILVRLTKEFGILKANEWWSKKGTMIWFALGFYYFVLFRDICFGRYTKHQKQID